MKYPATKNFIWQCIGQSLFYAVAFNKAKHFDMLIELGVSPNCKAGRVRAMPLIAFAILNGMSTGIDSFDVASKLLCAGADPMTIPEDLWMERSLHMSSLVSRKDHLGAHLRLESNLLLL